MTDAPDKKIKTCVMVNMVRIVKVFCKKVFIKYFWKESPVSAPYNKGKAL